MKLPIKVKVSSKEQRDFLSKLLLEKFNMTYSDDRIKTWNYIFPSDYKGYQKGITIDSSNCSWNSSTWGEKCTEIFLENLMNQTYELY